MASRQFSRAIMDAMPCPPRVPRPSARPRRRTSGGAARGRRGTRGRACGWLAALFAATGCALAAPLPAEVNAALRRAQVPVSAMAVVVEEVGTARPLLSANADEPMNPASLAKLVTTFAALDQLGPAWRWQTPVWLDGPVRDGVLDGPLVLRGSGDPSLVLERVWLLLRRVMQAGVRTIRGDVVLDRGAFAVPDGHPADFDNEPLRPYNVRPDALLLNYKSVLYTFVPDPGAGVARIGAAPALAGATVDATVPLAAVPCGDWRATLKASFGDDGRVRFAGAYPVECGERTWPVADPRPDSYNARLVEGLWREMGGRLEGRVRDGTAPGDRAPSFVVDSPSLAEVVRDINKYSNNTMAQQLFLTLALVDPATGLPGAVAATPERARLGLQTWAEARLGPAAAALAIDNGAGLSRTARVSARALAQLLQVAWASPVMPELAASLPVSGLDGTMRRSRSTLGRAHLKTGSLRDVAGVAGYVLSDTGRRYVLVAVVNHPNASAARPAIDALLQWTIGDPARRGAAASTN
jgi:D-alanyl-D-alanine carboxypeptidase/D-alanyl-D-alanine-endopeptidase (penicillin-binding protein 4)